MPSGAPLRVAIIDDDIAFLEALQQIIDDAEGFVCTGAFNSVEEGLPELAAADPEVLLLDIQLPGIAGDQAIGLLRTVCPCVEILMLTVFSDRAKVFASICYGASGYLLKSTSPAKLLDAIQSAKAGGSPLSPEIARDIIGLFRKVGHPPASSDLTVQEHNALGLLAEGYSYQSAANQLHVSVNTVRNYVRSIYQKLHVHSKSQAVSKALRTGLL